MAVEVAGKCFHWSPAIFTGGPLSAKTVTHAILSLINTPSRNSYDRTMTTIHYTPFLINALLHHSLEKEIARGGRRWVSSSCASFDGFANRDENEEEFLNRINKSNPKFKTESQSQRNQDAGTSKICDEDFQFHSIPPVLDPINHEIQTMKPESWLHSDRFLIQNMNRRSNNFDLPLSLRIIKKKKQGKSDETTESASSSVKKAFSSMVFIVGELQSHMIRMRKLLISPDNFQIQGTLARVHGDLHASFAWLFHRIFSSTPTLMLYLMLLLANFTVFSIAGHHPAAAPLPPQSLSAQIEKTQNPINRFDFPAIKTISICRSSAVGGGGNGGGKPPAIAGAGDDDGKSDRASSSSGNDGMISPEVISMAWKRIVEETAEMIRANGWCDALMDPDTLRRFVSPVTAVAEPDDLSAYCATELMYQVALAEDPDDGLLLSNFAQFLFTVHRDHDRAEEYFKRAVRAEPVEAETLCRYANFLWVARKDLGAAEETFLEAISADPVNSHYSANYAHFLWTTGAEDTCYPLDDCDAWYEVEVMIPRCGLSQVFGDN